MGYSDMIARSTPQGAEAARNAKLDEQKQQLIALYTKLNLDAGMEPTLASRLANQRAEREVMGGAFPKSPGDTLNDLQQESNLANMGRYAQELGLNASNKGEETGFLNSQHDRMLGLAGSFESSQMQRNERGYKKQVGDMRADMAGRGLFNSTIPDKMKRGYYDDYQVRNDEIAASANQQRLGVEDSYTGRYAGTLGRLNDQRLNLINSRTDEPPNLSLYAKLLSQPGMAGGMGGGGMYGGAAGGGGMTISRQDGMSGVTSQQFMPGNYSGIHQGGQTFGLVQNPFASSGGSSGGDSNLFRPSRPSVAYDDGGGAHDFMRGNAGPAYGWNPKMMDGNLGPASVVQGPLRRPYDPRTGAYSR